jgi:hypothetical protein
MDAVLYSQIISIGLLCSSVIPLSYLEAKKMIREKYIVSLVSNLLKIPILIFATLYYGLIGLILGKITAKIIGLITTLICILKNKGKGD